VKAFSFKRLSTEVLDFSSAYHPMSMYVKIAVNIPTDTQFTYAVPESLRNETAVGKRALVPFGTKKLTGYILAILNEADFTDTREILDVLDAEPLFTPEDLAFYSWAAAYYHYPLGKALHDILPGGIDLKSDRLFKAAPHGAFSNPPSEGQQIILEQLEASPQGLTLRRLQKLFPGASLRRDLTALLAANRIVSDEELKRPEIQKKMEKQISLAADCPATPHLPAVQKRIFSYLKERGTAGYAELRTLTPNPSPIVGQLLKKGLITLSEREVYRCAEESPVIGAGANLCLNDNQADACRILDKAVASRRFQPFLLHGVTGSGKTEVYFQAIEGALAAGGGALYLVPEIGLTPQLLSRTSRRFPGVEIAVLHSSIARGIRYDNWRRLQQGEIRLAVGVRSALFAPLPGLRLIIVDEEHDASYKQDVRMRYSARDLAILRARQQNAVIVLGSATPDVQTFFHARQGKYTRLSLPSRVENRPLPEVRIVDMKAEPKEKGGIPVLSRTLKTALEETFQKGMQALLFLNRRGFHTFLLCPECGYVFTCPNCSVSLTLHAQAEKMQCHYCDYSLKAPSLCPRCSSRHVQFYGAGTERLEKEIREHFPQIRSARMDRDTTARKGAHTRILKAFDRKEIDLLIGTQMITKGHDFPNVTLVGVIAADTALNLPDFRAAERTFQLLTQVSGRGGRGEQEGQVVIQTLNPDHYAIQRAKDHDYEGFYEEEIRIRTSLGYPPFSRLINLQLSSLHEERGSREVEELGRRARALSGSESGSFPAVEVIGPAEAPIAKIKGRHRWQLLLKSDNLQALHSLTRALLTSECAGKLEVQVDVDPMNFM